MQFLKNMFLNKVLAVSFVLVGSTNAYAVQVYEDEANSLSIFGRLQAGYLNGAARTINEDEKHSGGIEADSRLGFIGKSTIVTNVNAIAHLEWELDSQDHDDETFVTRYAYTGFDFGPIGVLTVGQQDTAVYQTVGFTDVFSRWGNEGNAYWDFEGRQEGQLAFINSVAGYTVAATYQTAFSDAGHVYNHDTQGYEAVDIKYGFTGSFTYNWERETVKGLAFSTGFDYMKFKEPVGALRGRRTINLALSYGYLNEGLYLAALYSRIKFAGESHHVTGSDIVGGYTFENGLSFMTGLSYKGYEVDKLDSAYINSEIAYEFSSNLRFYVEGRFGLGKRKFDMPDMTQHNLWTTSLQYIF